MRILSVIAALLAALCSESLAQTWTPLNSGVSSRLYAVHFLNQDIGWIGGEGSVIRKTTNGGSTWTAQSGSRNITAIRFLNSSVGWAVGGSGGTGVVLKTTNGGADWTTQIDGGTVMWGVTFLDSSRGWITGAYGSIQKTTNGGATWVAQASGTSTDLHHHWFADSTTGWVSGSAGIMLKTTNGGATWVAQNTGTSVDLDDIFFVGKDSGWAGGNGGVLIRTTNGGATWTAQTTGISTPVFALGFLNARTGYASSSGGVLLKTTDGGETWASQTTGTTEGLICMQFLPQAAVGWISGENGTLLKTEFPSTPPSGFTYSQNPASYVKGTPITPNVPSIVGSRPLTFEASTSLPDGLALNPATGVISGTPTTLSSPVLYTITATNDYGSATADVNISVVNSTAVSPALADQTFAFLLPGASRVDFSIPERNVATARIEIRTLHGARVWEGARALGNLSWDGTTLQGGAAPAGIYLIRLTWLDERKNPVGSISKQFALLRP